MSFGDTLRELMASRGVTQRMLGKALNLAPSTLGNYVCNIREPDLETLKRLASYFGVSTDYLLGCPAAGRPAPDEVRLVRLYRGMSEHSQAAFLEIGSALHRKSQ